MIEYPFPAKHSGFIARSAQQGMDRDCVGPCPVAEPESPMSDRAVSLGQPRLDGARLPGISVEYPIAHVA